MLIFYKQKRRPPQQCGFISHPYQYWHCPHCGEVFAVYCPTCDKFKLLHANTTIFVNRAGLICATCLIKDEPMQGFGEE
jgi:hypothetical protein